jgi:hypothetical protein
MSKGSPTLQVRLNAEFIEAIDNRIAEINAKRKGEPLTRSGFLFADIVEKLNKMERSKGSKKRWDLPRGKGGGW